MLRLRLLAVVVIFLCCFALLPRPAAAAYDLKLIYWPTTVNISSSTAGPGNWTTNFIGGDFRWIGNQNWGVHLKYDTGSEGSWGGLYSGAISGTDTVWSADVLYQWQFPTFSLRAFAGYGQLQTSTTFPIFGAQVVKSNGLRVGADASFPLPNSNFSFNVGVAWYPSNSTNFTFAGLSSSSSGSATDWSASIQYTWPTGWLAEAGYRQINANTGALAFTVCPCTLNTGGPFFAVGYRW